MADGDSMTPFVLARLINSSFEVPWSFTIRSANAFTMLSLARVWATLPTSTSFMPPSAARLIKSASAAATVAVAP